MKNNPGWVQVLPTSSKTLEQESMLWAEARSVTYAPPMGCFCPDDTWPNEARDLDKEEQPQQTSDWCKDIENAQEFKARLPTLRRRPDQPPNAIILHHSWRRRPAGWSAGVQSGFPLRPDSSEKPDLPKPAYLRTWHCTQSDLEQDQNQDECKYLEPVPRHEYKEPDDSPFQSDKGEEEKEENHYNPMGDMEKLK